MRAHKANSFTGYMKKAVAHFAALPAGQSILDIPAGNGQVTDALRRASHHVTAADINRRRQEYVYADMNKRLPFDDNRFNGVVCLEGIEHTLAPFALLGELIRVCKIGGHVVISTPNIMSMYSRLQFLLTGTFFNFHPAQLQDVGPEEARDRFHIAPVSFHSLRYFGEYYGAKVIKVDGDKIKRRVLLPIYLPLIVLGKPWSRRLYFSRRYAAWRERNRQIYRQANTWATLFSLSIMVFFQKTREATATVTHDLGPHAKLIPARRLSIEGVC